MESNPTFITTTKYSKWLDLSKKCVQKFYPESEHIIIDGRDGWPHVWFKWLDHLSTIKTKNFIMLDEDCFLLSRDETDKAIDLLNQTKSTLSGVPDAFFSLRNYNEIALNPFFMIGNVERLIVATSTILNWRQLKFQKKYFDTPEYSFPVNKKQVGTNYEIFYGLFWAILEAHQKLQYLFPFDDFSYAKGYGRDIPATKVRIGPETPDIAIHLWYSRVWTQPHHRGR